MNIYTSYYAKAKFLSEKDYCFVRVSTSKPKWWDKNLFELPELYPGFSLVNGIKNKEITEEEYTNSYNKMLNSLKKSAIIENLYKMSMDKDIILLCYEKPGDFCHRHLIAEWLGNVKEFDYTNQKENKEPDLVP